MRIALYTVLLLVASSAQAKEKHKHKHNHKAHSHGHASLAIAVDGQKVAIAMDVPGDVIFGFEHQPKTDAQKTIVSTELNRLKEGAEALLVMPVDANCKLTETNVKSSLEAEGPKKGKSVHSDVDAKYTFTCTGDLKGKTMATGLFKAWPRLKKLKIQMVGSTSQQGLNLTADATDIKL